MKLVLIFDHRFFRARDGQIYAENVYNYQFFADRYLHVFDEVSILSRLADRGDVETPPVRGTEGPGVKLVPLPNWQGVAGFFRHRFRILRDAASAIDHDTAVLMIVPGGLASMLFAPLSRCGCPIALEVVSDPWQSFQPGAYDHVLRSLVRHWTAAQLRQQCANACAVSYVTNSFLQLHYPCPSFSSAISDVVLPELAFAASAREFAFAKAPRVVCVGLMNHFKGHAALLEAVAQAKNMSPAISLVLVGDGPLRHQLEQQAEHLGIRTQVRFAGRLPAGDAIRAALDAADLFVLPSLTEGMPRALLEAMARGLPCIASAVGGIPEVLASEALVSPGDATGLANKLSAVLRDHNWLSAMSRLNLQKAAEFKDSVLMAKRLEFYQHIRKANESRRTGFGTSCIVPAIQ